MILKNAPLTLPWVPEVFFSLTSGEIPSPFSRVFFALAPIFARSKSERCFKPAETPTETLATQAKRKATDRHVLARMIREIEMSGDWFGCVLVISFNFS